ncbi:MAG: arginyl-tRNA synthetase [Bacteroidota bacterium]|jgi:arginyl-tRNA synthetase|nr:arginyl-tRNA synthetase [Bacteroidota bacterium]
MNIEQKLSDKTVEALEKLYGATIDKASFEKTNPDFTGDLTLVVFPFLKVSKKKPEDTANEIGNYLKENVAEIASFNVVKGFLNIVIGDTFWLNYFKSINGKSLLHPAPENNQVVMVEYSSPNTNKPLHLGHVRNNLLGYSVSEILKAAGNKVIKTNIVNDRGIHICKSMLAWQKWGNGETPESCGMKGDHLVGKYYVEFDKHYKAEVKELKAKGIPDAEAEKKAPLMLEIQNMLLKWEANDKEVRSLWEMMNGWVYKGFDETYKMLGVDFDKIYYESNTYILGKNIIDEGLAKGVLKRRPDNSVYADLTPDGLDEKTLLRADGTSVYMTQDLGTALERAKETGFDKHIYTVGNEQDYHFKVLFLILKKLGYKWADGLYHLSYGMVELPEGKMKSREGTVVDADELMEEMIATAKKTAEELGKAQDLEEADKQQLYRTIGLGALKYFILKVDPKKKMLFNPAESIDFNGNTAPFIQFNYVRIRALLRKAKEGMLNFDDINVFIHNVTLLPKEKELLIKLYNFNTTVQQAAAEYSPAVIANYVYDLAKEYSQYYHDTPILKEEKKDLILFRLQLSSDIGNAIKTGMSLLGIEVPERM